MALPECAPSAIDEGIKRSVETEGKPTPEFKDAVIIAAVTVTVVRFLLAFRNCIPVPAHTQVFTVLAADGDDFGFQRYLSCCYIQLGQQLP